MYKLISIRGNIQHNIKNTNPPINFNISGLEVECVWQHKFENLEHGDAMIVVGYLAKDEYDDPLLYVCAYFNITKNRKSESKPKAKLILYGLFVSTLVIIAFNYTIDNDFMVYIAFPIFLFFAFIAFFCVQTLVAYSVLDKEISTLEINDRNINL